MLWNQPLGSQIFSGIPILGNCIRWLDAQTQQGWADVGSWLGCGVQELGAALDRGGEHLAGVIDGLAPNAPASAEVVAPSFAQYEGISQALSGINLASMAGFSSDVSISDLGELSAMNVGMPRSQGYGMGMMV